jgi:hypothetical protein
LRGHEVLAELGLVANPGHLILAGAWRLVDEQGVIHELSSFAPSVGIPTRLAATVQQVTVDAERVVCVENLTPFYELLRRGPDGLAALYLGGNPAPACRHLLHCLAEQAPTRLVRHPYLQDLRALVEHMLARGFKLEQEAEV